MITAIELGTDRVAATTARGNGGGVEVVQSGSAVIGAEGLKAALAACGIGGGRAVLVVPRGQAILRDFEVPAGDPAELVAMVRFQAERELPLPLEQVRWSWIETGRADGKVRVQVAAVERETADARVQDLGEAGVRIDGIYVSSYGLLSLAPPGTAALIEVSAGEAEVLVARDGRMAYSHTAPVPEGAEALAQEVSRTLLAWSARYSEEAPRTVILAGTGEEAERLARDLAAVLSREVRTAGPGDLETAPATGLCAALLRGTALPDLLHPPEPPKQSKFTRGRRVGALAAAVVVLLFAWAQVSLADREDELEQKRARLAELKPQVKEILRIEEQTALAHEWYRDRNAWIPTLQALVEEIGTAELWITGATLESKGAVRFQGRTKDEKHVRDLVAALAARSDLFHEVKRESTRSNQGKGEYRMDFLVRAVLAGSPEAGK